MKDNEALANGVIELSGVLISPDGERITFPSRDGRSTEISYRELEQRIVLLLDVFEKARKIRVAQAALETATAH